MSPERAFQEGVAPVGPSARAAPWRRLALLWGPAGKGAAITCAVVAGAFWSITAVMGPQTPRQVTAAYLEAYFDQDWPTVWALTCQSVRDYTDYATFAERAASMHDYSLPSDVDISVGDVKLAGGFSEYLKVPARATTDQGVRKVAFDGVLTLAPEDGESRVCVLD